jgi:hypothetical protein
VPFLSSETRRIAELDQALEPKAPIAASGQKQSLETHRSPARLTRELREITDSLSGSSSNLRRRGDQTALDLAGGRSSSFGIDPKAQFSSG